MTKWSRISHLMIVILIFIGGSSCNADQAQDSKIGSKYVIDYVEDLALDQTVHKHWFAIPTGNLPSQWESFVQEGTGHTIIRISSITDHSRFDYMDGDQSEGLTNGYSRFSNSNISGEYLLAFSTDQALLLYNLAAGSSLGLITYDGDNYIGESCNPRWDLSNRAGTQTTIYYHLWGGTKIYKQDVLKGYASQELVYDLQEEILSEDHMDQDRFARYRAVRLNNKIVVLNLRERQILSGEVFVQQGGCDISTEGNWLYVQGFNGTEETRFYKISRLAQGDTSQYVVLPCESHGHDGWAFDRDGNEVYTFQDNTNDWFSAFNPESGERIDIIHMSETGWTFGQHMGRMINKEKKGWLLMSSYDDIYDSWADNQMFMLEIKSHNDEPKSRIWRIASTFNRYGNNYFAESFASISPDGNNIYWGANWMGEDNLELYRLQLPSNWHDEIEVQ